MRLPLLLVLPVLIVGCLLDLYIYRVARRRCRGRFLPRLQAISAVFFQIVLLLVICWPKKSSSDEGLRTLMWILYAYSSIYVPKAVFVVCDLLGKLPQLFKRARIKTLTWFSAVFCVLLFGLMWWGALINRYRVDVVDVPVAFNDLPEAFEGLRLVQISDLHVGTFGADTSFVDKLVSQINGLKPDVVVFTGDIVNRRTDELLPFVSVLSRIEAPMGVYSVLGNHDYGDYYRWPTEEEKEYNLQQLKGLQADMGWKMLNNSTAWLYAGGDSIALVGVENVGDPPFTVYGDLDVAYPGDLSDDVFKVLLSHNPAHWDEDIASSPDKNIALTLSGHTHAMQMELFGVSPAVWRYPHWGGMYEDNDGHRLYVNIGAGEVGIPTRIGATPELTLFTFKQR